MIRAAVGMNLPPDDARFEPGDAVPDAEKRLGKAAYRSWLDQGLLVDEKAAPAAPAPAGDDDEAVG